MDISSFSTACYFPYYEDTQNVKICVKIESRPWQKAHNINHTEHVDVPRNFSTMPYVYKKGHGTFQ